MDFRLRTVLIAGVAFGVACVVAIALTYVFYPTQTPRELNPQVAVEVEEVPPLPADEPPEIEIEWPWKEPPANPRADYRLPFDPFFVQNIDVIDGPPCPKPEWWRRCRKFEEKLQEEFPLAGIGVISDGEGGRVSEAIFEGVDTPLREGDLLPGTNWILSEVCYDGWNGVSSVTVWDPGWATAWLYIAAPNRYGRSFEEDTTYWDSEPESVEESLARIQIQGLTKTRQMVAVLDQWGNEIGRRPEPVLEVWIKGGRYPFKEGDEFMNTQLTIEKIDLPEGVIVSDPDGNHHTIPFVR